MDKPRMEPVQAAWKTFKAMALTKPEHPGVTLERRRMFMAGAQAVYELMLASADGTEEEAMAAYAIIARELAWQSRILDTPLEEERL